MENLSNGGNVFFIISIGIFELGSVSNSTRLSLERYCSEFVEAKSILVFVKISEDTKSEGEDGNDR